MRYYPVNLDIRDKKVMIIGGGKVAARKCTALLAAGARVQVIAPTADKKLLELHSSGKVTFVEREYREGDLAGAVLVFAATDSMATNLVIAEEAKTLNIQVDVVNAPGWGNFTTPALIARGDLLITVSTGGKSPALAGKIRSQLAESFGPEYAAALELLGAVREKLLTEKKDIAYNEGLLNELTTHNLLLLFKNDSTAEIDQLLLKLFGPDYSLAALGMRKKDSE